MLGMTNMQFSHDVFYGRNLNLSHASSVCTNATRKGTEYQYQYHNYEKYVIIYL